MNQSTYTQLTGKNLTAPQASRFETVVSITRSLLEDILGWPLVPGDWENQYLEIGKTKDEDLSCLNVDTSNLDDPDAVEGAYRIFKWNGTDRFLQIDPATAIHKVKLVRNDITCKTFDEADEYSVQFANGKTQFARYIKFNPNFTICSSKCACKIEDVLIAVDADWAFDELPIDLQRVWAEMISDELDLRKDVKSESITSHSYTKFDRQTIEQRYGSVLKLYSGANGTIRRPRIV